MKQYEYMIIEVVKNYFPRVVNKKRYYQSEEAVNKFLDTHKNPRGYYDYEVFRREVGNWEAS